MELTVEEAVHLADHDNLALYKNGWNTHGRNLQKVIAEIDGDHVSGGNGQLARLHFNSPTTIYEDQLRQGGIREQMLIAALLTLLRFSDTPETYRDIYPPRNSASFQAAYGDGMYAYMVCILHPRQIATSRISISQTLASATALWSEHPEKVQTELERLKAAVKWNQEHPRQLPENNPFFVTETTQLAA